MATILKERLDARLVTLGLVGSRERARSLIMAGKVLVNGQPATKAGMDVRVDLPILLKESDNPYVSRGGLKLEGAIKALEVAVEGRVCIDVGASTGGFTDCLLTHGARKVYAVDVGKGQLHWKLRQDERVINIEKLNARFLDQQSFPEKMELAVMDLSFISLERVLPPLRVHLSEGAEVLAMIKPQFEVGPEFIGKSGVVRDQEARAAAIQRVQESALSMGFILLGSVDSSLPGIQGNVEHFLHLRWKPSS